MIRRGLLFSLVALSLLTGCSKEVPNCGDSDVKSLLKQNMLKQMDDEASKYIDMQVLSIHDIVEKSVNENKTIRKCTAKINEKWIFNDQEINKLGMSGFGLNIIREQMKSKGKEQEDGSIIIENDPIEYEVSITEDGKTIVNML